jgi:signal peptidase I
MIFALILFILLVVTGLVSLADRWYFAKRRPADEPEPWWIEYPKSFFPVILIVFALRSFVAEPFRIPSGSMIPTLLVGDFILVNKYTYGIRLPILNKKIVQMNDPQRGDVMVFRFPMNPSEDYIKRVVAVPGDTITYRNKRVYINGELQRVESAGTYLHPEKMKLRDSALWYSQRLVETLNGRSHHILNDPQTPAAVLQRSHFQGMEHCTYNEHGLECKVPPGHYFVMGDNRDNSADSRAWGFVPDENIVGKAFFIWFNFGNLDRIGSFS